MPTLLLKPRYRFRRPRFYVPSRRYRTGTKPASPVLDTGHTFYTDLTGCWLFQNDYLDQTANNYDWTVSGGSDITFVNALADNDPVVDRSSALNANRLTLVGPSIGGTDSFSMCLRLYCRGTAAFGLVLGTAAASAIYTIPSGSGFKFQYYSAFGSIISTPVLPFNNWFDLTYTYNPTGTASAWYIDGVSAGTASVTVGAHSVTAMFSDAGNERFNGQVAVAMLWKNRVLSQSEAAAWSLNPYGVVSGTAATTGTPIIVDWLAGAGPGFALAGRGGLAS